MQKAFFLGVGAVAAAGEEAGGRLAKLRVQAQRLADELVAKGELNVEEARKLVDDLMQQAQQQQPVRPSTNSPTSEPRRIEIITGDEEPATTDDSNVEALRQQVEAMKEELRRLKRD